MTLQFDFWIKKLMNIWLIIEKNNFPQRGYFRHQTQN